MASGLENSAKNAKMPDIIKYLFDLSVERAFIK